MKQRNNSIDIFRYVCALMVVAIHAHPFCELGVNADFFFSTLLPRIAVPFFFAASGYFYIKKLESGTERCFSRYLKRIVTTYALWSVIYFIFTFCKGGYSALKWFAVSSVYNFFVKGSYYHFWFFPALIISVCLITVFYKMNLKKTAAARINATLYNRLYRLCVLQDWCSDPVASGSLRIGIFYDYQKNFYDGIPVFCMWKAH